MYLCRDRKSLHFYKDGKNQLSGLCFLLQRNLKKGKTSNERGNLNLCEILYIYLTCALMIPIHGLTYSTRLCARGKVLTDNPVPTVLPPLGPSTRQGACSTRTTSRPLGTRPLPTPCRNTKVVNWSGIKTETSLLDSYFCLRADLNDLLPWDY